MFSRGALLLGAALPILSIVYLPWLSAAHVEAVRKSQLTARAAGLLSVERVPICPARLEQFLQQQAGHGESGSVWMPGCRTADFPHGRVWVVAASETVLAECRHALRIGSNVGCRFEPDLPFLAAPDAAVSVAQLKMELPSGESIFWITAPLPWRDHLVARHRLWLTCGWVALALLTFLAVTERRSRAMRLSYEWPEAGGPPRAAEWLLLGWSGHKAQPDDLREEYSLIQQEGKSAALWYWRQTLSSLPALMYTRLFRARSRGTANR